MAENELKPGDMIASYRIVRKLGEGGMGAVYEALQEFTQRRAAVKLLHSFRADDDYKARFMQEARALAQQDHPNVVRLIDANITPAGDIWIAMEYLQGCTLRELCARMGAMPVETALHHLIEICDGVAAGHEIGIVHCDLKPENVFVTRQGATKVVDFGAARAPSLGVIRSTAAIVAAGGKRSIIGTPEYMSPEHLQGQGARERTDIFAIGTMGWEMLANRHWLASASGSKPHIWEIVRRQIEAVPPLVTDVRPDVPEEVALILQRAMEKDAALRWPSAPSLAAAFREARARYLAGRVEDPGEASLAKKWIGPGAWAVHGPPMSLPMDSPPVDDPSKRVVVQAPIGMPEPVMAVPVPGSRLRSSTRSGLRFRPCLPPTRRVARGWCSGALRRSCLRPPSCARRCSLRWRSRRLRASSPDARLSPVPASFPPVATRIATEELPPLSPVTAGAFSKTQELPPSMTTPAPMAVPAEAAPRPTPPATYTTVPQVFGPADRVVPSVACALAARARDGVPHRQRAAPCRPGCLVRDAFGARRSDGHG